VFDLFDSSDRNEVEAKGLLGSAEGKIQKRRPGKRDVVSIPTLAVCDRKARELILLCVISVSLTSVVKKYLAT
jgi:hypothetical protein